MHHLLDHNGFDVHLGAAYALLDDIRAELLLRQFSNMALKAKAKRRSKGHVVEVENILHNVIAERVLNELEAVSGDLPH